MWKKRKSRFYRYFFIFFIVENFFVYNLFFIKLIKKNKIYLCFGGQRMETKTLNEISTLWSKTLQILETEVDKMIFNTFLKDSYIDTIQGDKIIVICDSKLSASILNQQYLDLITSIVNKITGSNFKIIFLLKKRLKKHHLKKLSRQMIVFFLKIAI